MATIGIDLGASKCCVGVVADGGHVEILENEVSQRIIPSFVAFTDSTRLAGSFAQCQATINFANTVFGVKRIMGRGIDDPLVDEFTKRVPFSVVKNDQKVQVKVSYKGKEELLYPQQVTAGLLKHVKGLVETKLECAVKGAVISVPASFTNAQRQATKEAAAIAGLHVLAFINDTTAAAIAYCVRHNPKEKQILTVVDFGGGQLSVSNVGVQDRHVDVLSLSGTTEVGGEVLDELLMEHALKPLLSQFGQEFVLSRKLMARLRAACVKTKHSLSLLRQVPLQVDNVKGDEDFRMEVNVTEFNKMIFPKVHPVLTRCLYRAFEASGFEQSQVSAVLLVGGSSRIPFFQSWLENSFGSSKINKTVNPDEAVAAGATMYAAVLAKNNEVPDLTVKDFLQSTFCMSSELKPNLQDLFPNAKVPFSTSNKLTYGTDSLFNENTKACTYEIFEETSKANPRLHHAIGTLNLLDEFARATRLIKDVTFKIDRCGIFSVVVNLDSPLGEFNDVLNRSVDKLSSNSLADAVVREEFFDEDEQNERDLDEAVGKLLQYCSELFSKVDNVIYRENFPQLVESLSTSATETIEWIEDDKMAASKQNILARQASLETLFGELISKVDGVRKSIVESSAAAKHLITLCSKIDKVLSTDEVQRKDSETTFKIRNEVQLIQQWLMANQVPSVTECEKKMTSLQGMYERLLSGLQDHQLIIDLRSYCLNLQATLPETLPGTLPGTLLLDYLKVKLKDCLHWLDTAAIPLGTVCASWMATLKTLHRELVVATVYDNEVTEPALLLRRLCLHTRTMASKSEKVVMDLKDKQQIENAKKQVLDYLVWLDGGEPFSAEEYIEKIGDVLVTQVTLENCVKKAEEMVANEGTRLKKRIDFRKRKLAIEGLLKNVQDPLFYSEVMAEADELLMWLTTPFVYTEKEYLEKMKKWELINERLKAKVKTNCVG